MLASMSRPTQSNAGFEELKRIMEQSQAKATAMHKDTMAQIAKLEADQAETRTQIRDLSQLQQESVQRAAAQPAVQAANQPPPQQNRDHERYDRYNRGGGMPPRPRGSCYYCGHPGHFSNDCQARTRHFAEGLLTMRDGRPVIAANGQSLPMVPPQGMTLKDLVEQSGSTRSVNMLDWDGYNDYSRPQDYPTFEQKVEQSLSRLGDGLMHCTQQLREMRQGSANVPSANTSVPNKSMNDMVAELYKLTVQGQDFH